MLKHRIITATIFLSLGIFLLQYNIWTSLIFVIICTWFAATEYLMINKYIYQNIETAKDELILVPKLNYIYFLLSLIYIFPLLLFIPLNMNLLPSANKYLLIILATTPFFFFSVIFFILPYYLYNLYKIKEFKLLSLIYNIMAFNFGFIYITIPAICIYLLASGVLLTNVEDTNKWHASALYFVTLIVIANDTGAYFIGKAIGKIKLASKLSPKKTLEGAIGGLFVGLLCSFLSNYLFKMELSIIAIIASGLFIGIIGIVGDLFESGLKRIAYVKDSGKLLPGHGGMLDRIDSLLFAAPVGLLIIILDKFM